MKFNFKRFFKNAVIFIGLILLIFTVQLPIQLVSLYHLQGLKALGVCILYLIGFGLAIFIAGAAFFSVYPGKLRNLTWRNVGFVLLCLLVFFVFEAVMSFLNMKVFHQLGTKNNQLIFSLMESDPYVLVFFGLTAVFASPILEELVFRGFFMNAFFKKNSFWLPIVISGLLFSCGHISSNVISFAIYAFLGMLLGYLYKKTGKIEAPILLHTLNNLLAMINLFIAMMV